MAGKINLMDRTIEEIKDILESMGQARYRGKQIFQWIARGVSDIDEMTDISKELRRELKKVSYVGSLKIAEKLVSKTDGTIKYLFELEDKNIIESVLMKYKYGFSACISSQVGCRMGCSFCASTGIGYKRNLSAGEFIGQILAIQKDMGYRIGNIVIMGIGEPFDNYENVLKFLQLAHAPEGLNIGYRKITVSTCGLVPEILKLSQKGIPINLSISLHAPNDKIREKIMPVNKRYSIDKIVEACKIYTGVTNRRITFEYILISDLNDTGENALELAEKLKGMLCHVNLIPMNEIINSEFRRSSKLKTEEFRNVLEKKGIETTIRRELGEDINAACGQLRRKMISDRPGG